MTERRLALVHVPQQGLLEGFSSSLIALANFVADREPEVEVELLDYGLLSRDELPGTIARFVHGIEGQLFVGISTTTASYQSALRVARIFKQLARGAVVVFGGHHASPEAEVILEEHSDVDFVIAGEGETALLQLVRCYPDVSTVPNLVFREGLKPRRGTVTDQGLGEKDLDSIAPTFRGWGLRSAPGKFDHVTYVSARGCPLQCAFCAVANKAIRNKSIDAVIRDLRYFVGELGYRQIALEDNFFAHSRKRTIELCRALEVLQRELPFGWDCQTRVESMQRLDVLEAMERAGCEAVYLGVEAFHPELLLHLRKTGHPGSYLRMLEEQIVPRLLDSSIDCYLNLQLGLSIEEEHHRRETLGRLGRLGRMAAERGKTITVFPQLSVIYPGTRHFHEAAIEGRLGPEPRLIFEKFTKWESEQEPILKWLGEHFAHGTGGIPEGILMTDLLRNGKPEVDSNKIIGVVNYLEAVSDLAGIRVFKYGRYLARDGLVAATMIASSQDEPQHD